MNVAEMVSRLAGLGATPEMIAVAVQAVVAEQQATAAERQRDQERRDKRAAQKRKERSGACSATVARQSGDNAATVAATPNGPSPLPPRTPPITPTPKTQFPPDSPDGLPAPSGADDVVAEAVDGAEGDREADEAGKGAKAARARRIPADFAESPEALAVCAEMGLTGAAAAEALAEFCDFWMAEGGQRARKLDWPRTLRNRLREMGRRRQGGRASPHRPRSSNGFYDLLRDELAGSDDQRSDPQQRQHLRLASGAR